MTPGTLLTASAVTLYTVPALVNQAVVAEIRLCNTDTVARTATVYLVKTGDTAGAKNTILQNVSLQPGATYKDVTRLTMLTGDTIQAFADVTAKVSIFVNGVEYAA